MSSSKRARPNHNRPPRRAGSRTAIHRPRGRRATTATIAVGIALLALVVVAAVATSNSHDGDAAADTSATAFDLPRLNGRGRVRLADLRGHPTVVNFFASWCTACDDELPEFKRAAESLEGEVNFVFVNSNEDGNWRPMAKRNGILGLTLARDVEGSRGNGLYVSLRGTGGMPITAFYDAEGKFVDVAFGALLGGALDDRLEELYGVQAS